MALGTTNTKNKVFKLDNVEFTENGVYIPNVNVTGFGMVKVSVPNTPINQDKVISEDGIYTADQGYTGLGKVVVNAAATFSADIEAQLHAINSGTSENESN